MPLSSGEQLGHYKILSMIGRGGMGEVYLATDTRLGRSVAIKVSSREFNDRFEREAQAISTLNHPNICTLYDIGPNYLVMEHIEGETLSKMIERGPLPLDKALSYAVQIVDALSSAHANGVIHRDLKPGNVIITKNGAKVLDFGLAKIGTDKPSAESAADIQTVTEPITRAGAILGTLFYMAPEQVEGKEADERSDIFSFGVVFYEMLTGQRPFNGDTQAAVLAAILKDQPAPMSQRQPAMPKQLERVVRKCLEKKPEDRWQSARDLKPTLEMIDLDAPTMTGASSSVPIQAQRPPKKSWLLPVLGAVALIAIVALAWTYWPKTAAPTAATRFQVTLPDNVNFGQYVSVSPDGRKLVFTATGEQSGLWIHDLNTLDWRRLTGTENALGPFWSPDSRSLGFGVRNELKRIDIAGGPPQTLCSIQGTVGTGAWSPDGVIVFGTPPGVDSHIRRVSASGGVPADLTALDTARGQTAHALPTFLPDGKHFLYLAISSSADQNAAGIYSASIDVKPGEQSHELLLPTKYGAPYVGGNLFFVREGTLMTQPFDAGKIRLQGDPVPVAVHVSIAASNGLFSVSPTGVLVYRLGAQNGISGGGYQATWYDRAGKATGTVGDPGLYWGLSLAPDTTRAAFRDTAYQLPGDIWLLDLGRGVRTRLTFRQSQGSPPIWSPDGTRIIFSGGNLLDTIYEKSANGAGEEKELLKKVGNIMMPSSWSRDGRFLLYSEGATLPDLWVLPLQGDLKPTLLLGTPFGEGGGSFSPDGRWVAYISNESGRTELYVRPFVASGPALGEGKWQLSKDGAETSIPKWTNDGKGVIFTGLNQALMAVEVNGSGAAFQMGTPKELFARTGVTGDSAGDGKRFLIAIPPGQSQPVTQTPITVVLNWQADLKR